MSRINAARNELTSVQKEIAPIREASAVELAKQRYYRDKNSGLYRGDSFEGIIEAPVTIDSVNRKDHMGVGIHDADTREAIGDTKNHYGKIYGAGKAFTENRAGKFEEIDDDTAVFHAPVDFAPAPLTTRDVDDPSNAPALAGIWEYLQEELDEENKQTLMQLHAQNPALYVSTVKGLVKSLAVDNFGYEKDGQGAEYDPIERNLKIKKLRDARAYLKTRRFLPTQTMSILSQKTRRLRLFTFTAPL